MITRDTIKFKESSPGNLLEVKGLSIYGKDIKGEKLLLDRVSFQIKRGSFTALMGRSGIGKSLTVKAILGLLKEPYWRLEGDVIFYKEDSPALSKAYYFSEERRGKYIIKNGEYNSSEVSELRGKNIFTIFQGPDSHLHPSLTIGWQIGEAIDCRNPWKPYEETARRLNEVGLNPVELKSMPINLLRAKGREL